MTQNLAAQLTPDGLGGYALPVVRLWNPGEGLVRVRAPDDTLKVVSFYGPSAQTPEELLTLGYARCLVQDEFEPEFETVTGYTYTHALGMVFKTAVRLDIPGARAAATASRIAKDNQTALLTRRVADLKAKGGIANDLAALRLELGVP